jgi:hypothetical protein
MTTFNRLLGACLAGALLLAGCGGGGGGASSAGINGGGAPVAPTSAFAKGTITGFGSIFVNGVEYSTSGAQFRIDDNPGVESDLRVGQVVAIQGTINSNGTTGTATTVTFNNEVEGPVSALDRLLGTFTVLGQTVRVNATTTYDDSSLAGGLAVLNNGDVVEVTGFRNGVAAGGAGEIVATRIQRRTGGIASPFEVTGKVSNLVGSTFNIGFLGVSFAGVVPTDGTLANDGCAEVKGTSFTQAGLLVATSVEVKSCGFAATSGARGEIEGIITVFRSAADFDIGGQTINTTASTTIVTNGLAGGLRANIKVEAEGSFNASGVLVATKVEIKPETELRLLGNIQALSATAGTVVVNGVTIQLSLVTRYEDKSSARVTSFDFADLRTGDYVEIRGFAGAVANTIQGVILERDDNDTRHELQGFASNVSDPTLVILGVTANTTGAQFRDINDLPMNRADFFAQANGRLVKVRGTWNGSTFLANQEAQIESP